MFRRNAILLVSAAILIGLAQRFFERHPPAVASSYAGTLGTPALFSRALFPRLKALSNGGAKGLIAELANDVSVYDFPGGELDIDSPADYTRLQ